VSYVESILMMGIGAAFVIVSLIIYKLIVFPGNIGFGGAFFLAGLNAFTQGLRAFKRWKNKKTPLSREEQEEKIKKAGEEGEKQVAYALGWLDKDRFKTFNNIRLAAGGESQEFDSVVVGEYAIFNIETKNYVGDLEIDSDGNWYRITHGGKRGMQNPVFQVQRHNKVLNDLLQGKYPIVDLIVWANIESVIYGIENSLVKLVKVDQLVHFIDNYKGDRRLSKDEREQIISAMTLVVKDR
jgi:hypothetical protein